MEQQKWIDEARRLKAPYIIIVSSEFAEEHFPVYVYEEDKLDIMKAQYENSSFEKVEEVINMSEH